MLFIKDNSLSKFTFLIILIIFRVCIKIRSLLIKYSCSVKGLTKAIIDFEEGHVLRLQKVVAYLST